MLSAVFIPVVLLSSQYDSDKGLTAFSLCFHCLPACVLYLCALHFFHTISSLILQEKASHCCWRVLIHFHSNYAFALVISLLLYTIFCIVALLYFVNIFQFSSQSPSSAVMCDWKSWEIAGKHRFEIFVISSNVFENFQYFSKISSCYTTKNSGRFPKLSIVNRWKSSACCSNVVRNSRHIHKFAKDSFISANFYE